MTTTVTAQSSLDVLDYKIGNYDQVERSLAAVSLPNGEE